MDYPKYQLLIQAIQRGRGKLVSSGLEVLEIDKDYNLVQLSKSAFHSLADTDIILRGRINIYALCGDEHTRPLRKRTTLLKLGSPPLLPFFLPCYPPYVLVGKKRGRGAKQGSFEATAAKVADQTAAEVAHCDAEMKKHLRGEERAVAHLRDIYEGLYLGGEEIAGDVKWLHARKIKVVYNVAIKRDIEVEGIEYVHRPINDDDRGDVVAAFATLGPLLMTAIRENKPILVHCKAGRTR